MATTSNVAINRVLSVFMRTNPTPGSKELKKTVLTPLDCHIHGTFAGHLSAYPQGRSPSGAAERSRGLLVAMGFLPGERVKVQRNVQEVLTQRNRTPLELRQTEQTLTIRGPRYRRFLGETSRSSRRWAALIRVMSTNSGKSWITFSAIQGATMLANLERLSVLVLEGWHPSRSVCVMSGKQ